MDGPTQTLAMLAITLESNSFYCADETMLQDGIAQALTNAGIAFDREVSIGAQGDRIDFVVPIGIGVEVKIKGGISAIIRQLCRYAASDRISALLLVTTRMQHDRLPSMLGGKPLRVVHLIGSSL